MASVTSLQKSGRLRIFAVCTPQRVKSYPDIPTAIESGIPDMLLSTFNVVSVPARTPQAIVDQLARHATAMMRDEALAKDLEALGVEPHIEGDPAKVNAYVEDYRQRLKPLLKGV